VRSSRLTNRVTPTGVQISPAKLADAIAEGSRLTDRDHQVIGLLAEHEVMTADQLARVAFPNGTRARHRLHLLAQRGVLARFRHNHRPGSAPWLYTLGLLGAAVDAVRVGADLPRPAEITNRVLRLHYSLSLSHLLGVNDFFTRLIGWARAQRGELSLWWPEREAARACGGIVRPDGYGEWAEDGTAVGFFYEHDTGTETLATLVGKVERYAELADTGVVRPVLLDLPTPGRETNLHRALTTRYGPAGPPAPVATASTDPGSDHEHRNPAGPLWLPVGAGTRRLRLIELGRPRTGRGAP